MLKKASSDVSSLEYIEKEDLDYDTDAAIEEMNNIVGLKDVDETSKLDIAYFRFLLYVKQNSDLSDAELKIYENALKKVEKAKFIESEEATNKSRLAVVRQRESRWF